MDEVREANDLESVKSGVPTNGKFKICNTSSC